MIITKLKLNRLLVPALFGAVLGFAQAANAVTIIDTGEGLALITCDATGVDPECNGYTKAVDGSGTAGPQILQLGTASTTDSDVWILANSGNQTERDALAIILGVSDTDGFSFFRDNSIGGENVMFTIGDNVEFWSIKFATTTAFFRNLANGLVTMKVNFDKGTGGGLSHISTWGGEITIIPLPAALPIFLLMLGGTALVARRRRGVSGAA